MFRIPGFLRTRNGPGSPADYRQAAQQSENGKDDVLEEPCFPGALGYSIKASGFRIDYEGCIRGWSCIGAFRTKSGGGRYIMVELYRTTRGTCC